MLGINLGLFVTFIIIPCLRVQASCNPTQIDDQGPFYKANSPLKNFGHGLPLPSLCENSDVNDRLFLNGTVRMVSTGNACGTPVRAMLDIWQADAVGKYSDISPTSSDFGCRTRFLTDVNGFFSFSSVFPGRYGDNGLGRYPGRPPKPKGRGDPQSPPPPRERGRGSQGGLPAGDALRPAHVHFKITPLDTSGSQMVGNTLTTQVYFALDKYLQPNDMCGICNSGDPTLTIHVAHETDIKTYSGSWDILLQP